jgi:hypothetical protein
MQDIDQLSTETCTALPVIGDKICILFVKWLCFSGVLRALLTTQVKSLLVNPRKDRPSATSKLQNDYMKISESTSMLLTSFNIHFKHGPPHT